GRDLVAYPFGDDLALELRERQQDVEGQPAHAVGSVERLGHADERGTRAVEDLDDLREVRETAREPVDLVDDDDIDPVLADVIKQSAQPRPIHRAARPSAIIIGGWQQLPSLGLLAAN